MRAHRVLPAGCLSAAVIFLFITAFDPWPTEAKADDDEARCLAIANLSRVDVAQTPTPALLARSRSS